MNNKTKKNLIICIFTIMTIIFSASSFMNVRSISTAEIGRQNASTLHDRFKRMIIEDSNQKFKVNKEMAISKANDITGVSNKANSIHSQLTIMTNEDILAPGIPQKTKYNNPQITEKGYLYKVPVWIISYEGLNIQNKEHNLTESNIVIDATTGEEIFGYIYR